MKSAAARLLDQLESSSTSTTTATSSFSRTAKDGNAATGAAVRGASSEPLQQLYNSHRTRENRRKREERSRRDEQRRISDEYLQQMPRRWQDGDVLAPHDLSASEMRKWRRWAGR